MNSHSTSVHLSADEAVRVNHGGNHDAIYVEEGSASVALVLPHYVTPAARVAFLAKLSEAASDLADEINLRDLEAAS